MIGIDRKRLNPLYKFWLACMAVSMWMFASPSSATDTVLELDDASLNIHVVQAQKTVRARLLWLPSEYGILPQEKRVAEQLAKKGIESWFVDVYEALFLPPTPSAVDAVPSEWIERLIDQATKDALPAWVIAPNKAAQLAVRGLSQFQRRQHNDLGLILINPNLYLNTPLPGQEAQYWAEVSGVNLPISVLQSELSPWRWRVMKLADKLAHSGSDVFVKLQPKSRDRYYFRPDALPIERQVATHLADDIRRLMQWQLAYLGESRVGGKLSDQVENKVETTRSTELQIYSGDQNRNLNLQDLSGEAVSLADYKGKVVLLNFWASWCPPCVHEMPSMARLNDQLDGQPFEILAVNLAEEQRAIKAFLMQHPVNFPILQDPSGSAVKTWQVFAYPSSYLIDKQGKIRFALFGGTEWDQESHLNKIKTLLSE
ncbi:TlpA disulfide reductase family protein [Thiomicrorhabdus sp.]|uniref:TlpA disulfide reductase family protein n=1 Tax=Thiomicrorhabdus sp. TaxID=2039724 RepID=UPI003569654A